MGSFEGCYPALGAECGEHVGKYFEWRCTGKEIVRERRRMEAYLYHPPTWHDEMR